MRQRRSSLKASPGTSTPILPLRVNDLLFVNAYQAAGFRSPAHIDAYQSVHPGCKRASARVGAERLLQKPIVKEEIARRMQFEAGITRVHIESSLLKYQSWADEKQDYVAAASIAMDCAKLAGFLVDKKQDVPLPVPPTRDALVEELRQRGVIPPVTAYSPPVSSRRATSEEQGVGESEGSPVSSLPLPAPTPTSPTPRSAPTPSDA